MVLCRCHCAPADILGTPTTDNHECVPDLPVTVCGQKPCDTVKWPATPGHQVSSCDRSRGVDCVLGWLPCIYRSALASNDRQQRSPATIASSGHAPRCRKHGVAGIKASTASCAWTQTRARAGCARRDARLQGRAWYTKLLAAVQVELRQRPQHCGRDRDVTLRGRMQKNILEPGESNKTRLLKLHKPAYRRR